MITNISQIIGNFIATIFFIFIAYLISFYMAIYGVKILGYAKNDVFSIVVIIVLTSILSFVFTLLIHYLYQKLKFLDEKKFIRNYHGVHQIYLYISGLLGVIGLLEPILLEEKIIDAGFNTRFLPFIGIVFFVILSNYTFYNSFVINNEFIFFETLGDVTRIKFKNIIVLLSIIIGTVFLIRYVMQKDEISLVSIILIAFPWFTYEFFKQASNNDV